MTGRVRLQRPRRRVLALLATAALGGGALLIGGIAAAGATPVVVSPPVISGTPTVGSPLSVTTLFTTTTPGLTYAYTWKDCDATGASCATANRPLGLWAASDVPADRRGCGPHHRGDGQGHRSQWQQVGDIGADATHRRLPLHERAAGPVRQWPPRQDLLQQQLDLPVPDDRNGVTTTCQLDAGTPVACPSTNKITYSGLTPGVHTVTVTAKNAAGSAVPATYTWTVAALPAPVSCPACYHPPLATTWQWQLNPDAGATGINSGIVADMYDIDGFDNSAATVATLHGLPGTSVAHRSVLCYWSAGTLENWRPDVASFPATLLGNTYPGFANERWFDIRQLSVLGPLLEARMDMCKAKGFDGFEFDNVDAWDPEYKTGLNLTSQDEVAFIAWLANQAHLRGMSMALKNDIPQIPSVLPYVDFAVNEQCFQYKECLTSQNGGVRIRPDGRRWKARL